WIAESWARSTQSQGTQYLGLGLFVVAEAIIFLPLLWYAQRFSPPDTISTAAILTGVIFGGLTVYTLTTRADFSGLGRYLALGMFAALGVILCSIVFGMNLSGSLFSSLMILLAAGYVLYETSNVMHRYRTNQHVAAALALFAAVALMFWYILRLLIAISGRD
ncbi:MAG: permease, partial [Planctomycetaceae bacterium]|nr:permease [Planctomycetaceae bacterium]